jgi:hypothetical protein
VAIAHTKRNFRGGFQISDRHTPPQKLYCVEALNPYFEGVQCNLRRFSEAIIRCNEHRVSPKTPVYTCQHLVL